MPRLLALVLALAFWPPTATDGARVPTGDVVVGESSCFVAAQIERDPEHASLIIDPVIVQSQPDRSTSGSDGRHFSMAAFRTALLLGARGERCAEREALRPRGRATRVYDATAPPA